MRGPFPQEVVEDIEKEIERVLNRGFPGDPAIRRHSHRRLMVAQRS
jgi:hypothetical protein